MTISAAEIERQALAWLTRVNDPAFADWDDWQAWLAADARHAETYWRLAAREADVVETLKSAPPRAGRALITSPRLPPRRAALAAALAGAVGLSWFAWSERPQPWLVETAPGQLRTIDLADGSQVHLAGATRLQLDRGDPRKARLEQGRALFQVVHDDRAPFRVRVGEAVLTDLGTVFDVTRLADGARVAVSEGVVRVDQQRASETLHAGQGVLASSRGLQRRNVAPEAVSGWREGRLSYTDETLAVIAQDLERTLGRPVTVAPQIAERTFSGSLSVQPQSPDLRHRLSRLLGVTIVQDGEAWRLQP